MFSYYNMVFYPHSVKCVFFKGLMAMVREKWRFLVGFDKGVCRGLLGIAEWYGDFFGVEW